MSSSGIKGKKRILVFPFELLSHYLRCIVLAERYPDHEVLFAHSATYGEFVRRAGFDSFAVSHFDAARAISSAARFDFGWLDETDIREVFVSQVQAIQKYNPVLVIGDANPSLKMAAEYCGIKYISLMNGYMSKHYARTRSLPSDHPAHGFLKKLPAGPRDFVVSVAESISMRLVHRPFKKLRKMYGLKSQFTYLDEMEGDLNLICDDMALFPQKNLPLSYEMIGPLLYSQSWVPEISLEFFRSDKPVICVSMGSTGSWQKVSFLSKEKYAGFNIVTAGDDEGFIRGGHVRAYNFVDFNKVLPFCKFLICHGGNGTTYFGIRHKVFVLCVPDHFEQEWNIQGLEALGYGRGFKRSVEVGLSEYLGVRD